MLYIVPTPIGNLKDITIRAKEALQEVDLILCEDTRTTGRMLELLGLKPYPPLTSFHEHNEDSKVKYIIERLKNGEEVALVSDAGTPTISDPGYKLIAYCHQQNLPVTALPGASSVTTALSASGFPTDKFIYLGFLPKARGKKEKLLQKINELGGITIVAFESPKRLKTTLIELKEIYGNIELTVSRELTKKFEQIKKQEIYKHLEDLEDRSKSAKGEVTLVWSNEHLIHSTPSS